MYRIGLTYPKVKRLSKLSYSTFYLNNLLKGEFVWGELVWIDPRWLYWVALSFSPSSSWWVILPTLWYRLNWEVMVALEQMHKLFVNPFLKKKCLSLPNRLMPGSSSWLKELLAVPAQLAWMYAAIDPNSDPVGELAIAKFKYDCPACRVAIVQMLQTGQLSL